MWGGGNQVGVGWGGGGGWEGGNRRKMKFLDETLISVSETIPQIVFLWSNLNTDMQGGLGGEGD